MSTAMPKTVRGLKCDGVNGKRQKDNEATAPPPDASFTVLKGSATWLLKQKPCKRDQRTSVTLMDSTVMLKSK